MTPLQSEHSASSKSGGPSRRGTTPPLSYVRTARISCDPCRKRKLKCDRIKPCTTCVKRGISHQCYQEERGGLREDTGSTANGIAKRVKVENGGAAGASQCALEVKGQGGVMGVSQIAADMAKCKDQMDAIALLASQSSSSLGSALSGLSNGQKEAISSPSLALPSPSVRRSELVVWRDVSAHLPSMQDCEALIAFYLEEICSYYRVTQRPVFEKHWRLLVDGTGIHRTEAAMIFTAFAMADVLIPSASSLRRHSREDHHRWMTLLGDPASSPLGEAIDNSVAKIQLLNMVAVYHLYAGGIDHLWESIGVGMRKAIIFGLFDERTKSWIGLSNLEREYRRRLAWYLLVLDRWISFVRQLPFALDTAHVFLAEASFEPDSRIQHHNTPARIVPNRPSILPDGRLQNQISARKPGNVKFVFVELLDWCQDYLSHFAAMTPATRYHRALLLDDALERVLLDGLHQTGIEHKDLRCLSTSILDECIRDRHVEIISFICSIFFLRCMITRRFLTDENAPNHLRWVSINYAQGILSTIPSLTRLMNEGQVPVQTTWISNFLLAAATTFTVVILGQDHYVESQSNPLEVDTSQQGYREGFPQQHVQWLAENIFLVLDCLDTLITTGNYSASMAKQLLERLCMAQGDLRQLYRVRINRLAESSRPGPTHLHNHHHLHQHNTWDPSPQPPGSASREDLLSQSTSLQMSQSYPSLATPATTLADSMSSSASLHSTAPPVSATSLLDAVLMEPTELDILGQNHMELLQSLLKDSPPIHKTGRGAGILSLLDGSRSYSTPSWARSLHPRRYAHDTSHYSYQTQNDAREAPTPYRAPPKAWSHLRLRHPSEVRRHPTTLPNTPPEPKRADLNQPPEANAGPFSSRITIPEPPIQEEAIISVGRKEVDLESKKQKRRPASKTVLNGGISHRERTERRAQLKRIEETIGVREAQALQRRYEKEDATKKEKRKALIAKLRPYIEKQLKLIELESEEQRKEVEARKTWSLAKLTKEGWAIDGLEGFWLQKEKEKKTGQSTSYTAVRTAVLNRPGKARLGWTKVQKGDQVELKKVPKEEDDAVVSEEDEEVCTGTVRSISENEIRINLEAPFHDVDLIAHPLWRIELAYNDLIEQRLKDAVESLTHDAEATQRAGAELSGTRLVELLLEGSEETRAKVEGLTMAEWIKVNRPDSAEPDYGNLNETQRQAIQMMLSEPISLIQGPPGTGKTSTIVAAIRILKQHYKIPHAILLTSHTNVAVDNLAQGCKDAGLNVIRAGHMVKVRESLNDVTVEGLMQNHPSKPRLDELEANKVAVIKALQGLQDGGEIKQDHPVASVLAEEVIEDDLEWLVDANFASSGSHLTRLQRKLSLLMQKTFVLRREMETDIFRDLDVVCCTALSAPLIRVIDFPLVFFDEASMATEPITLATMIKGCQQLSLIGDQQQLSPLIKSREVLDEGLGLSLFERLMERGDMKSVLLSTQHRMHPSLSDFPNHEFYGGRLSDASATSAIVPIHSSYLKLGKHLSFVNHKGKERVTKSKSLENKGEADMVIKIIADILSKNEDISGSDIGIVTPYLGQKELLWKSLQDPTSHHRSLLANEIERLGGPRSRITEVNEIEIHTIDGFEGREKKVIVFSLVRANALKYLGFLKEEKRWNVALTRAKNALVIVGNASMLERSDKAAAQDLQEEFEEDIFLHRYADHLRQHDCIIDAKDVQQQQ